jgi:hypothetical protein
VRKRIGRSDIIGEQGIAHIRRVVLDMGYVFYETGGIEAGIDGYIELRDPNTGEVGNLILQVQGKATERDRLPAETANSFEWPSTDRHSLLAARYGARVADRRPDQDQSRLLEVYQGLFPR